MLPPLHPIVKAINKCNIELSFFTVFCCNASDYIPLSVCNVQLPPDSLTTALHQPLIARSDWTWAACPVVQARNRTCLCGCPSSATTWRRFCWSCSCCRRWRVSCKVPIIIPLMEFAKLKSSEFTATKDATFTPTPYSLLFLHKSIRVTQFLEMLYI